MKSSIKKRTFKAIYRLLDKFSPVNGDCGLLCDCACCTCNGASNASNHYDEDDLGIYLLPGEHKIFTGKEKERTFVVLYLERKRREISTMKMKNVKTQSVKALANVSLKLGKMSADSACCYIFHQPKMPETLKKLKKS